jgi:hypothetical protein
MNNLLPKSFPLNCVLPRVMASAPVALHVLLLLAVVQFTCAAPSLSSRDLTESESPVEEEQGGEESVANSESHSRIRHRPPTVRFLVFKRERLDLITRTASLPPSGHRFANHLLAPLRC